MQIGGENIVAYSLCGLSGPQIIYEIKIEVEIATSNLR